MPKKTVLITGGVKGIGRMVAKEFAAKGFQIVLNYRSDEQAAHELVKELQLITKEKVTAVQGDISNAHDCTKMIDKLISYDVDSIDVLIHNAGPYIKERKRMSDYSIEEWNYMINGNLNSVFYISKLILPMMRKKEWGRIITYGYDRVDTAPGWIYRSAFAAAKSGLASLTKTLALEEAPNGITVNMVCPGDIDGDWKEKSIIDAKHDSDRNNPIGRPGTGEDIARAIAFLCDDSSDFITGAVVPVTGGMDVLGKVYRRLN
ncbi:SDR family oxidoreductase [Jeotgalibacillus soli]|uniref:3-ketoacyl-ACP reductase n=1 Tax=Jeotgalibacillus soli TaxID=889306 RepID=A0A0C2VJE3_9BACL|nr:SDR family oxidoreductase [Jeotgalibacillus soli]KIL44113.1 hypothetical protein KP78_30770 [Jeotgalibacillus soli]